MKKDLITVIIHTRNEEKNIAECITAAQKLTENIVVIDMESTDETVAIVVGLHIPVFTFPFSNYVEPARGYGIEMAQSEWVMIIDADERMTDQLTDEINKTIRSGTATHFKIPRNNYFAGFKLLRHGGWYPDYVIRLIKKDSFEFWPEEIHSTPRIKDEMGYLTQPLHHYFHPNLTEMVQKTALFESIESELLFKAKKNVSTRIFFRKYFGELNRRLIMKLGFLDGAPGVIESLYQAYSKTITYIFLYEKYKKSRSL